jgi:biotin carboxyl carrier protein
VSTTSTVEENGNKRTFRITLEPPASNPTGTLAPAPATAPATPVTPTAPTIPVFSPFKGKVELVELKVKLGDAVTEGQVVAAVEAMKAKHDVRAPANGKVVSINFEVGSDIVAGQPILTLGR